MCSIFVCCFVEGQIICEENFVRKHGLQENAPHIKLMNAPNSNVVCFHMFAFCVTMRWSYISLVELNLP